MINDKIIIVGLPGSGISNINKDLLGVSKYFTTATSEDINNMYLKDYMCQHTLEDIEGIYNNEYYITMYNSVTPSGSLCVEGVSLNEWDDNKYIITTPYEFINIPQNTVNSSIVVHMDCNYKYVSNNYPDDIDKYKKYMDTKYSCNKTFMDMCNNNRVLYFFNEPVERVACICKVLKEENEDINNILIKGLKE